MSFFAGERSAPRISLRGHCRLVHTVTTARGSAHYQFSIPDLPRGTTSPTPRFFTTIFRNESCPCGILTWGVVRRFSRIAFLRHCRHCASSWQLRKGHLGGTYIFFPGCLSRAF